VEVEPLAASTFIDEYLLPRKFEAALVAVDPGPDPDPDPFWHSSQIAPPPRLSGLRLSTCAAARAPDNRHGAP
jgi:hypothetical protein